MTTTPPEEIERQHQAALNKTLQQPPSYAEPPLVGTEIPLSAKVKVKTTASTSDKSSSCNHAEDSSILGPCWSSRGYVDVSALADLVREGYQDILPSSPSGNSSASSDDEKKSSDEAAAPKRSQPATSSEKSKTPSTPPSFAAITAVSPTNLWSPHTAHHYNVSIQRPSHDAWGIGKIMLVFADDFLQTTYEFPYYAKFRNLLEPLLQVLQIDEHQVVRLLLASLPPGVTIPVHQDTGNWVQQTHRVHIPILVHDASKVVFECGYAVDKMQRIDCTPGHVFEINNQRWHAVSNCDTHHRVHMILDYMHHDAVLPKRIALQPKQVLLQTRRSIDLLEHKGRRPTPSFMILGAQKAGTTSLYEYMMQHPLIIAPKRRETHSFDWRWISEVTAVKKPTRQQRLAWMHKFYHYPELQRHPSCLTGDSTPSYLLDSRRVIPRLRETIDWPIQFLVMLRHPVKRAESHFAMVTSTEGTDAQLQARGMEWRNKSFADVVRDDLEKMKACGLIPYFNVETGSVDQSAYDEFAYSQQETDAWNRYLQDIPLNTGSHSLLGRGLYELNLRPWLTAFSRDHFLVIQLEQMTTNVSATLDAVWKHLDIPSYDIDDVAPKNQRTYDRLVDPDMEAFLERFYEPHNRRLHKVLGDAWLGVWECNER